MNTTRLSATLLALLLSVTARGSIDLDAAIGILDRLDRETLQADFDSIELTDAIELIDRQLPIPIVADWEGLRQMGIRDDDRVSLSLGDTTAATALAALLLAIGDDFGRPVYEVHASQIVITAPISTAVMRMTSVYDVRDLLADGQTVPALQRSLAPSAPGPAHEEGKTEIDGEVKDDEPVLEIEPRHPAVDLIYMIMEHVDPDVWIDYGGASGKISHHDGAVIVTAVPSTHRRLRRALLALRQATPSSVMLDASLVRIEAEELERIQRRTDRGTAAYARAIGRAGELQWRAETAIAIDSTWTAAADGDEISIEIEVTPRFDRASGYLQLQVSATSARPSGRRSVSSGVDLPQGGVAVLELVTASPESSRELLVLVPYRR